MAIKPVRSALNVMAYPFFHWQHRGHLKGFLVSVFKIAWLAVLSQYQDFSLLILHRQPMWSTRVFVPRNDIISVIIFLVITLPIMWLDLDSIVVDFAKTKRIYDFYFINPFDINLILSR
jgi:hypothetical protein